eukprot:scaffold193786_cov35-Prasinocladus_malaysianus.AAC.1
MQSVEITTSDKALARPANGLSSTDGIPQSSSTEASSPPRTSDSENNKDAGLSSVTERRRVAPPACLAIEQTRDRMVRSALIQ